MALVKLQDGPSDWTHVRRAAGILWRSSICPDIDFLTTSLQQHFQNPYLRALDLRTTLNASRRGVVVCDGENITIAFIVSDPKEANRNLWSHAKGPDWWDVLYPVYDDNGNQVHSYFRDMWHAMRQITYGALSKAVDEVTRRGAAPKHITVAGYSMGGGISM